jgi:O-antigen ligase
VTCKVRYPVELGLLLVLCFFLPIYEAPKNLAWVAYVVVWGINRVRSRDAGGRWDTWDTLIGLWIASGYVVAAFAGLHFQEWRGAGDLLRYGSILWCVKRARYTDMEIRWVLGTLVLSLVVGLAQGYWRLWTGIGKSGTLQLHSVGHVNHTAIYIAILLGVCASALFAYWKRSPVWARFAALLITLGVLASLVVTASRGAAGVGLIMLPMLALVWWRRWRAPLIASVVVVTLVGAAAFLFKFEVVRKQQADAEANNVLSYRDAIWRTGLVAFERFPLFGVGMDNYSLITQERVKDWRAAAGKPYDPARYLAYAHAHNVYINTLAERGLFGFAALVAILAVWFGALLRRRPHPAADDLAWFLWGSAASGWIITTLAGTVNTTMHHEHAILAVLLLGLWLSRPAANRAA